MRLLWRVEDDDVRKVKRFYNEHRHNDLVVWRRERNIESILSIFARHILEGNGRVQQAGSKE
jgi:hypothetical protein